MKATSTLLMRMTVPVTLALLLALQAFSQARKITGKVLDSRDNSPLPGVSVQVKGTSSGTQTKADGTYSLDVPSASTTLVFSFIGYLTQEKPVGNDGSVNVSMSADVKSLQDVVVVGYGTQRRSDLTGAVASVKSATLQERPAASVNQALAGRIPGVQVNTNSGRPGGQTNIRIRGFSSINTTNNPLYVIDGIIIPVGTQTQNSNAIDFLNPNDIESVEVLKDASATAIYGARGANGVILVTTKRGSIGSRITYDTNLWTNTIGPRRVDMLNAREYMAVEDLAWKNAQIYDPEGWNKGNYISKEPKLKRTNPQLFDANGNPLYDTDWLKESVQHKISHSHQLGFTGGNEDSQYGLFLGYRDDNGLLLNSYLKRYSARFTFDSQIKSWMKVGGTLSYTNQIENLVDIGTGGLNSVRMITEALPFLPVKMQDGTWSNNKLYPGAEGGSNPVHIMTDRKYEMQTQNVLGNAHATIALAKGLELRSVLGANIVTRGRNEWNGRTLIDISATQKGIAVIDNNRETYWSFENYLTYNKRFSNIHSINALAGVSWQEDNIFGFNVRGENYSTDYFENNNLGAGALIPSSGAGSRRSRFAFNSYFGRVNYGFKDKYLVTFTGRVDGSSKFGANHKYAFFPSAALAWRVSEEPWLKGNPVISTLKLRTSFGITGNSEIDPYSSLATLAASNDYAAAINGLKVQGVGTNRLPNKDLKWEKTAQYDFGMELGLIKNRISLETDLYYRKTTDMLLDAPVPNTSGYTTIRRNIGSMENKGLEIGINSVNVDTKDFTWSSSFNISFNKNKVLSLATPADIFAVGGPNFTNQTNIIRIGEPVGSFWGLVRLGTWSTAEAAEAAKFKDYRGGKPILPGDIKYLDVNGDYAINDADRMIIGNGNPKGWGAFSNTFRYKNLDLTVELQYTYGNDILNMTHHSGEDRTGLANSFRSVLNYWTADHQNTDIAAPRDPAAGYVTNVDTRWIEDGSFLRGKNLLLGYTFPKTAVERLHLSKLRITGSVQNFFLSTKFSGNDPEVTTYSQPFAQGQTFFDYPKPTTYQVGINAEF
ncbi:SusC/RagA family TonB-linked outer membrane protein [Chitinophaga tropicalis]|uniref:SusC/RagA family TonB-linked outer membrane protein n=1 Tax=Chitinophaga tropicalis TaxID=2683588 RepID=A0A7K1TY63_9BACT|nr:TonB-dependent receptor [Chitinophaga tropicalis]MVT07032.1 SusC/RagA family TonB-linked outer membrane protein [Chitinophaga tropicalis]